MHLRSLNTSKLHYWTPFSHCFPATNTSCFYNKQQNNRPPPLLCLNLVSTLRLCSGDVVSFQVIPCHHLKKKESERVSGDLHQQHTYHSFQHSVCCSEHSSNCWSLFIYIYKKYRKKRKVQNWTRVMLLRFSYK